MKRLHRSDLYCWSVFDETKDIDFHSYLWVRKEGNVLIDPLPLSSHDRDHLDKLGALACIIVTNSDHLRDAAHIADASSTPIFGPKGERNQFPLVCKRWLADGDEVVPGLVVFEVEGSKTPGELVLLLEETTLITGDLIRAHEGNRLCLLPDEKLSDKTKVLTSIRRLSVLPRLDTVLPGDGWPLFQNAKKALKNILSDAGHF